MNTLTVEYQQDFCSWINHNAELLRKGVLSEIDAENIAEELESMGKSQYREIVSRLKILFAHLLKWQFEPDYRSNSWKRTIIEQRHQIKDLLDTSPSLKHQIDEKMAKAYSEAVEYASAETGISESDFPRICPYTLYQALDKHFFPDSKDVRHD